MKKLGSDNCLQPDNIHYVMAFSFFLRQFSNNIRIYGLAKSCGGFDLLLFSAHFLANYVENCSIVAKLTTILL